MKRLATRSAVVAVVVFAGFGRMPVLAAPGDLLLTIESPNPHSDGLFGNRLAVVNNNIVAADFSYDGGATDSGIAYMFHGQTGQRLHTFSNPAPSQYGKFGGCLTTLGDDILISGGTSNKIVRLYDGDTYGLIREYPNPTPQTNEAFGRSFVVNDNILIGDGFDSTHSYRAGGAYLFDQSGTLLHTFENPTPASGDRFGDSLAWTGEDFLIGAHYDNTGAADAGIVYMFDGDTKELVHTFENPSPEPDDRFGGTIAVLGNKIFIGAAHDNTGADNAGVVYMFNAETKELVHTFLNPTPEFDDRFGVALTTLDDYILIGAFNDHSGANAGGAVYMYDQSGTLLRTFTNPTPQPGDYFGERIVPFGNNIVVGATKDHYGTNLGGAVYVFQAIPEPSSLAMLGVGAVGLLIFAWRKRHH